jgi:biotin operon repressor
MNPLEIPEIVIKRLPLYLRTLNSLAAQGQTVTSSQEMGEKLGISSTQIRKDLSYFGEFGKQGTGYDISYLQDELQQILQVSQRWNVALIGAGDLGRAILRYSRSRQGQTENRSPGWQAERAGYRHIAPNHSQTWRTDRHHCCAGQRSAGGCRRAGECGCESHPLLCPSLSAAPRTRASALH